MADSPRVVNAHIALLIVGAIYGANYVIAKSVMPEPIGPEPFILLRVFGAVILFWIIKLFIKEKVQKRDYLRLVFCGLTGVAVNQLFFFKGLSLTSPINASIIMTCNPIIVMVMAAVILKNPLTKRKIIGVSLGAIGSIALIWMSKSGNDVHSNSLGDLFILINAISYAIYLILVKPLMSKYKPLTVISWAFLFGLIMVIPFGIGEISEIEWMAFSSWQVFSVFYVIIATTFFAYLLNIYALSIVQPTVSSAYIYLQPIFATVSGFVFAAVIGVNYSADIGVMKISCAALIFVGIYLVSFERKRKKLQSQ